MEKTKMKKAISLVILVITIIVMIILASTVIISLNNSDIIGMANSTVGATNLKQVQDLATTLWTKAYSRGARTQAALEQAVMNALGKNENIDLSMYEVIVTTSGVEVKNPSPIIIFDQELSADRNIPTDVQSASYTISGKVTDESKVKTFKINGSDVEVNADGTWSLDLTLVKDEVLELTATATDNNENITTKTGYVGYIIFNNFTVTATNRDKVGYTSGTADWEIPRIFYDETNRKWYKVIAIDNYAFDACTNLTNVVIPDSVTTIGVGIFRGCTGLTSAVIPNGVTSLPTYTFTNCTSLTSLVIPNSITSIGYMVFSNCTSLVSIGPVGSGASLEIPDSVTSIAEKVFQNCSGLTSVIIPNGITTINSGTFNSCTGLETVTIHDNVTSIVGAFNNCYNLKSINIPNGVTEIGAQTFQNCHSLTTVTIPDSVMSLGNYTFYSCKNLKSVIIGSGITKIPYRSLSLCSSLESVVIPKSVTTIDGQAFASSNAITDVYYTGTEEEWSQLTIGTSNGSLATATVHYEYAG